MCNLSTSILPKLATVRVYTVVITLREQGSITMGTSKLNRNVETAVTDINGQIDSLTKLGVRRQFISARGYRIQWSNNERQWWRFYQGIPASKGWVDLDANELFVSGHTKPTLEEALPLLKWHPLFWNSYEAQQAIRKG